MSHCYYTRPQTLNYQHKAVFGDFYIWQVHVTCGCVPHSGNACTSIVQLSVSHRLSLVWYKSMQSQTSVYLPGETCSYIPMTRPTLTSRQVTCTWPSVSFGTSIVHVHVSSADIMVFLRCSCDPVCFCSTEPHEHKTRKLCTRVGTLIVATIYLQLIQNRYMFRSFTVLQCSHQHCV